MGLGARVARDQGNDALDLLRVVAGAGIYPAFAKSVEPQHPVGVHHDFDHGGVGQGRRELRTHRGAEHRAAAPKGVIGGRTRIAHPEPPSPFGGAVRVRWPPERDSPTRVSVVTSYPVTSQGRLLGMCGSYPSVTTG